MGKRKRNVNKGEDKDMATGNTEANDDSSDDELPCALSPYKTKPENDFKMGDMIFAKFERYPYWPGLFFKYVKTKKNRKRKGWVYFFEGDTMDSRKIVLPVPLSHIKMFSCEQKAEFMNVAESNPELAEGFGKAEDYLRKRACNKIKDFFDDAIEAIPEDDENDADDADNNEDKTLWKDPDSGIAKFSPPKSLKRLFETRKSSRHQGKRSKEILSWIYKEGRKVLREVNEMKRPSLRHKAFMHGSQREKDRLKWLSGFGAVKNEEQSDKLLKTLRSWHVQDFPDVNYNAVTYVSDVWLPEVIIRAIMNIDVLNYEDAEKRFFDGD